jgi:hypothetical protein
MILVLQLFSFVARDSKPHASAMLSRAELSADVSKTL